MRQGRVHYCFHGFDGIPGKTYRVQCNENVDKPLWQELSVRTADEFGLFLFIDTTPGGSPQRYYRSAFSSRGPSSPLVC